MDILESDGRFVDQILGLARAVIAARDRYIVAAVRQTAVGVVDGQGDLGIALALAAVGAVKDNVLHLGTAQGFGALFTQHPTDRVADIGLAGAVGADDGGDALVEGQFCFIGKGFESL